MTISIRGHLESLNGDVLKGLLSKLRLNQKGLTRKAQIAEAIESKLAACKRASQATLLAWAGEPLARLIATSAG